MHASTVLAKTAVGQRVLKDRSVPLVPRQRSVFIQFDGHRTVAEVLQATAGLGVGEVDLATMVEAGLLEVVAAARPVAVAAAVIDRGVPSPAATTSGRSALQRYKDAYPIATQLTAGMGLRGFRLNLAIEQASGYEDLRALAPRIRAAVGEQKYARLDQALNA